MQRAFIIRPFGKKRDSSGTEIDFERVHDKLVAAALEDVGLGGGTTGEIIEAGNIREDMFALIIEADLVVCDITVHNANVFYELGIRHALRKRRSILIKAAPSADDTPFDVLTDRYLAYDVDDPGKAKKALADVIKATLASPRETDSPIFKMLPGLPEVDPATVQVVPTDFAEEVGRAAAAKMAGWLRLLATEVTGLRFQWPALRLIANAQWELEDRDGALRTWRRIHENDAADIDANLALADVHGSQYRQNTKPELIEASNRAITRVLENERTSGAQRAWALAHKARNLRTVWRLEFEGLDNVGSRRKWATRRALLEAYEASYRACLTHLNHYWPGLVALQLGTIALDLSRERDTWQDAFDTTSEAVAYKRRLARQVKALCSVVQVAIEAALEQAPSDDKDRVWAEISRADLLFLIEKRHERVIKAYIDGVPTKNPFAWNAARGQLRLFADLGIKADLANEIISSVDARMVRPGAQADLHVVVFAGHRPDEPGRSEPRFPPDREQKAQELIREELEKIQTGGLRLKVLASAAPGSDIICHALCRKLGIESTICLPMPKEDYASLAFGDLDAWRSRYLALINSRPLLQLSSQQGLPRWLHGSDIDPWERGNRWVLAMAQTMGARKVTLIVLWDGKMTCDRPGGTGHIVRIAREQGTIELVPIDAKKLLT